jgi:hypothetical protein
LVDLAYRNLVLAFTPEGTRRIRPSLRTGTEVVEGEVFNRWDAARIWLEFEFGFGESAWRVQRELRHAEDGIDAFLDGVQVFSILFLPGWVGPDYYTAVSGALVADMTNDLEAFLGLVRGDAGGQLTQPHHDRLAEILSGATGLIGLSFANASDEMTLGLARQSGVHPYFPRPRILIVGAMQRSDGLGFQVDLREDSVQAIPYAGVPERLTTAFHVLRGRFESALTGEVLRSLTGLPVLAADALLDDAREAAIPFLTVSPTNLRILRRLTLGESVSARVEADATGEAGVVVTPEQPVAFRGGERAAWWHVESGSGRVTGVLDDGTRGAASGFAADGRPSEPPGRVSSLVVAEQMMDLSEALFEAALDQISHGRHLRDQACVFACDARHLADVGCGEAASTTLETCLRGAPVGDDPLGLGLSCGDMIDALRCGSWIGRAVVEGELRVDLDEGGVYWGPWGRERRPLGAGQRCPCR